MFCGNKKTHKKSENENKNGEYNCKEPMFFFVCLLSSANRFKNDKSKEQSSESKN